MNRSVMIAMSVAAVSAMAGLASASTLVVDGFGVGGWTSWDTRNTSGTQLVGTNDTSPAWAGTHTTADDTAIEKQIIFMGEGQTVNTSNGSAPPAASPTGSLGGLGYVRLEGTSSNSGKSDISYVNTSGITPSTALLSPSFTTSYTYNIEPNPTFRTLGLNISLIGTDARNYTFAHVQDGSAQPIAVPGWNTETIDSATGLFTLFVSGVGSGGPARTLDAWALDPTYGAAMFGTGAEVYRLGFNIGSSQKSAEEYLDSVQSSILNGGDLIDFQAPSSVPEPASLGLLAFGAVGVLARRRRRAM